MSSDLLTRKLHHSFDHMDVTGTGDLGESDYEALARRVTDAVGHPLGTPAGQRIRERFLDVWNQALAPMRPEGCTTLPREVYIDALRELTLSDSVTLRNVLRGVAETYFEIADLDADGWLSLEEFRTFQQATYPRMSDADVEFAFTRLDTDGDGALAGDEFIEAILDYQCSTDPAVPGNAWLGPLPD